MAKLFNTALQDFQSPKRFSSLYGRRDERSIENLATRMRILEAVKKQGGWKSLVSIMRYKKHTQLALVVRQFPPHLLKQARAAERELKKLWPNAFA